MDFLQKLANAQLDRRSSEHLKLLGKRAAGLYVSKDADSLSDAVLRVTQEDGELNNDQIARISEMANQETWRTMFVEGGSKDVSFEPANADHVIGEMAQKPEVDDAEALSMLDYGNDVPGEQIPDDIDLADAFGVEKDSPAYDALNPAGEAEEQVEKVASALDVSRYGVDEAAASLAAAGETFYQMVKSAHLDDGHGFLQLSKMAAAVMHDQVFAANMMSVISARMEHEGVKFDRKQELQKVAHPLVVNTDHPLAVAASVFERAAYNHYCADAAHEKLAQEHKKAVNYLREKLRDL